MLASKAFSAVGLTALLASLPELTVQALLPEPEARLGDRLRPLLAASGAGVEAGPPRFGPNSREWKPYRRS